MGEGVIVHINAPYFNAGAIVVNGTVTRAAPIVGYMIGWNLSKVVTYCRKKGWTAYGSDDRVLSVGGIPRSGLV